MLQHALPPPRAFQDRPRGYAPARAGPFMRRMSASVYSIVDAVWLA